MKMKKISVSVMCFVILLSISGCRDASQTQQVSSKLLSSSASSSSTLLVASSSTTTSSVSPKASSESSSAVSTKPTGSFDPVLFIEKDIAPEQYASVLCVFRAGQYNDLSQYKYSGKDWSDFVNQAGQVVTTDILQSGDSFTFFNAKGEDTFKTECSKVFCQGRGIDSFTEVRAYLSTVKNMEDTPYVGLLASVNPFPRKPTYTSQSISVDLDGEGHTDSVTWILSQSHSVYALKDSMDYTIAVQINGETHTIKNDTDLPIRDKSSLSVFVADVNSDGKFEILVYDADSSGGSGVTAYVIDSQRDVKEVFTYVANPGP